ncbi:hypothetical protein RHGRI_030340 [Rhododendron griersonianum]|uniref:Uncharacterized protein n=1 Tax=Rhododendron griersonianum TaxID=479676 RepID=A0AAV6IMS0_9ERIC|nr:hypothetical protein RHGRI_030340 [Rhododendron griersonianum]
MVKAILFLGRSSESWSFKDTVESLVRYRVALSRVWEALKGVDCSFTDGLRRELGYRWILSSSITGIWFPAIVQQRINI